MKKLEEREYNIYVGLGISMGGTQYQCTIKTNEDEAYNYAYQLAREEYESYEGLHGILSWEDCAAELGYDIESDLTPEQEEEISEMYNTEVENFIEYYCVPTEEDKETPESELERASMYYERN